MNLKTLNIMLPTIIALFSFSGCAEVAPSATNVYYGECVIDALKTPEWICGINNYMGTRYVQTSHIKTNRGAHYAKATAYQEGKKQLCSDIYDEYRAKVAVVIRKQLIGADDIIDDFSNKTALQAMNYAYSNATVIQSWNHVTNNKLYVMTGISEDKLNSIASNTLINLYLAEEKYTGIILNKDDIELIKKEFTITTH